MASQNGSKVWSSRPTDNIPPGAMGMDMSAQAGFIQKADMRAYQDLRTAVLAEERQRRISLGLSPDPPTKMARLKNWLLKREEQAVGDPCMQPNSEEITKL